MTIYKVEYFVRNIRVRGLCSTENQAFTLQTTDLKDKHNSPPREYGERNWTLWTDK